MAEPYKQHNPNTHQYAAHFFNVLGQLEEVAFSSKCFVLNIEEIPMTFKILYYRPHQKLQIFEQFWPKNSEKIDESSRRAQPQEKNVCS